MSKKVVSMSDVTKIYRMGENDNVVLKGINLDIYEGEFLSILGPSGSGKSTLMNIIGCLDIKTSGKYVLSERPIDDLNETQLARIRNKEIGFIFQSFQLLPNLTAIDNVELPLIYSKVPYSKRKKRAFEMLEKVGLADKVNHYPNQLSGGQQQRVAIARALVTNPSILLADEPTGALDQNTGKQVMKLFKELNEEGRTIIMITHDHLIANYANRIVQILDGNLIEHDDLENKNNLNHEEKLDIPSKRELGCNSDVLSIVEELSSRPNKDNSKGGEI